MSDQVVEYDDMKPSVTLKNGERHTADIVVAVDGKLYKLFTRACSLRHQVSNREHENWSSASTTSPNPLATPVSAPTLTAANSKATL